MSLIRFSVLPFFLLPLLLVTVHTEARAKKIDLQTQPALEQIHPFSKPAKMTLALRDDTGKAIHGTRFQIRLYAPPRGWFFSTDFPQVEGTSLIELELPDYQGSTELEYVFPIRGVYRLEVSASDATGAEVKRVYSLSIEESRIKLIYLGIFLAALFAFGVMVGRLFTSRSRATGVVAVVLWLVGTGLGVCPAMAQGLTTKVNENEVLSARLEVSPATVGHPSEVHWRLEKKETKMSYPAQLSLAITQLEKGKRIFLLQRVPTDGNFVFKFHFVDGSRHQVSSIAELKGRSPIRAERVVAVTGIEPPKAISLRALVFFLLVLTLGLMTGRLSRRAKKPSVLGENATRLPIL